MKNFQPITEKSIHTIIKYVYDCGDDGANRLSMALHFSNLSFPGNIPSTLNFLLKEKLILMAHDDGAIDRVNERFWLTFKGHWLRYARKVNRERKARTNSKST